MARKRIRTTIPEIVDYWARHTDECGLSVDFAEAHERCWRCGCRRRLERCHIVPDSLSGEDTPSNFVILCKRCHLDNPNVGTRRLCGTGCGRTAYPFMTPSGVLRNRGVQKNIWEILCRGASGTGDSPGGPGIQGDFG